MMRYRDHSKKLKQVEFNELKGLTLKEIHGLETRSDYIEFITTEGRKFTLMYYADCCATCDIEDICGDPADLIGHEILLAEEVISEQENPEGVPVPESQDSFTWSFYKLSTIKGSMTIRWYGESNGYYSETVTFEEVL